VIAEGIAAERQAKRRGWRKQDMALVRTLRFRDFEHAKRFVDRLSEAAVDHGRRPDMCISSNRVRLTIANRNHAGLTEAETRLAEKVDAVIETHGPES
jgi:pterin-4a-carbinolamine dehydratase